jgi:hypothetical protein
MSIRQAAKAIRGCPNHRFMMRCPESGQTPSAGHQLQRQRAAAKACSPPRRQFEATTDSEPPDPDGAGGAKSDYQKLDPVTKMTVWLIYGLQTEGLAQAPGRVRNAKPGVSG